MKKEYEKSERGPTITLSTREETISLHIPPELKFPETWENDDWKLMPLVPVKVSIYCVYVLVSYCILLFSLRKRIWMILRKE